MPCQCAVFGEWGEWEQCSHSCGEDGTRSRHRQCVGDSSGTCPPAEGTEVELCPAQFDCPSLELLTPTQTPSSSSNFDSLVENEYNDIDPLLDGFLSSELLQNYE